MMLSQVANQGVAPKDAEQIRHFRPFFWVVLFCLGLACLWTLATRQAWLGTGGGLLFAGLFAVHAGLYWFSPMVAFRPKWLPVYLGCQGLLVLAIGFVGADTFILLLLNTLLLGSASGLLQNLLRSIGLAAVLLALFAVHVGFNQGWPEVLSALGIGVGLAIQAILYVTMFLRLEQSRQRDRSTLARLQIAHAQLADYAEQVETLTISAERQRMARELHDTLAQGLAGLIMQLEAIEVLHGQGEEEKARAVLKQAKDRARTSLGEARRAIDDLRQAGDMPETLEETIRAEVDDFRATSGVPCSLSLDDVSRVPADGRGDLVAVVREALTNVARHAQASQAVVTVGCGEHEVVVEVRDDGRGFRLDEGAQQPGHYGLQGLRERADLRGGNLVVTSSPGAGCSVRWTLPLRRGDHV